MLPLQLWAIFSSTLLFKFGCTVLFQFYMIICWAIVLIVSTFQLNNVSQYSGFLAQVFIVLLSQTMLLTWGSNMHIEPIFFLLIVILPSVTYDLYSCFYLVLCSRSMTVDHFSPHLNWCTYALIPKVWNCGFLPPSLISLRSTSWLFLSIRVVNA